MADAINHLGQATFGRHNMHVGKYTGFVLELFMEIYGFDSCRMALASI